MIAIELTLIIILVIFIIALIKSTKTLRKIFLSILTIGILIPVILILLIKPAQQGKLLPLWGKISLLFFEPKDLWQPLAEASLEQNKREYNFIFSHKYVGNHNVIIIFSNKIINAWEIDENELSLTISVYDGTNKIFSKKTSHAYGFMGLDENGLTYIEYSLPEDLPLNKELKTKIEIAGNIEKFLKQYSSAKIVIRKGSDE